MNPIIRAYEARVDDINSVERSVVAKISTQDVDRYKTVFLSRGCDITSYNANKVVLWCHGKDPIRGQRPIGKNQWVRIDRGSQPKIIAKTIFNDDEFSMQLFRDYQNEFLNAWSISVLPTEHSRPTQEEIRSYPSWADAETVYRKYEMLEYSACGVPGNSSCTTVNENEVRDLCEMVNRGYYIFPEVRYLVDQMTESDSQEVAPIIERMSESGGLADGGALVADNDDDDDDDDDGDAEDDSEDAAKKKKKKKKKRSADDEGDAAADDQAETTAEAVDDVKRSADDSDEDGDEPDDDDDDDDAVTRDGPIDEPRDSHGRWTDEGSDPEKSKVETRKRKLKAGDDDEYESKQAMYEVTERLQAKYDEKPLYKTHPIIDKKTGETLHVTVSKNAAYHGYKSEKKYVIKMWSDQSKHEQDRETANDLQKAAKIADRMHKNLLRDKHDYKLKDRGVDPDEVETVDRTSPETEVETKAEIETETAPPEAEPVDMFAGLPPFAGRSFVDVYVRRSRLVNAWIEANQKMIRDFNEWRRGKG